MFFSSFSSFRRLLNLLPGRRRKLEHSLEREIQYHVDRRTEDLRNSGLDAGEARRRALLEFGGAAQVQEEVRATWLWRWLAEFVRDTRYASRNLWRNLGFTITAVLSLALGIGANTAIFSILYALVLRSLPVSDPEHLVVVTRNETVSAPYPWFADLRDHSRALSGVLAFRTAPMRFGSNGETERINGALVSGTYFDVLGVQPALGTAIAADDDRIPGSGGSRGPVAVLSYRFWQRRFGGQSSAIGARILLNGQPFTVAGIAPAGFYGTEVGEAPDLFAPMAMQAALLPGLGNALSMPRSQWLRIFGRLQPGITPQQAEAEITTLLRHYNAEYYIGVTTDARRRRTLLEQRAVLLPAGTGISSLRSEYSKPLWVLMGVVALVLLIACANVASLLLSRAAARRREIAIRLSLGAARARLISQLFTESLILAVAGAGSGLLLAYWLREILVRYLPANRSLNVAMDSGVLCFTLALGVGASLFFGVAPAFASTNVDVAPAIKGSDASPKLTRLLFRKGLVAFQMSLSCLLLIAAALFLRSLHNLLTVDAGFVRENILVASVDGSVGLDSRLSDELSQLPGVTAAAIADSPPLGVTTGWDIFVPGFVPAPNESRDSPSVGFISPGYFGTMGTPLLLGRDFDRHDLLQGRDAMIVNETFARHYFGGRSPVGQRVGTKDGVYQWEIIGVVKDSKYSSLREGPVRMVYVPFRPGPWASRAVIHLRTATPPATLASALRQKIRDLDPSATVNDLHTVEAEMDRTTLRERLVGTITALFGLVALVLAAIGLYGLVAYGVALRTREFGIRIAVGAPARGILGLVIRDAAWLLAIGAGFGLAAAWALRRLVAGMLFGVAPADPLSAAVAVLVLVVAALAAAWIPARRASRVDPVRALRCD